MNLYEYQRSTSFIDLDPSHSDSTFSNFFCSETAYGEPGAIARSDERPPGMRTVEGSILTSGKSCFR